MNKRCNHCLSEDYQPFRDYKPLDFGVSLVQCNNCGHVFSLIQESIDYDEFYRQGKYVLQDNRGSFFDKIIGLNNSLIVKKIRAETDGGRLLDFGSGKGQFLSLFDSAFWDLTGVETSIPRARFASEHYGLNIHSEFYESGVIGEGSYNVITLFHVLEHLTEPKALLKKLITGNLKAGGLVVLEVPLIESWQSQIAKDRWMHLDPPIHFSHYSKIIIDDLLFGLDITPIRYSYFSLPLGMLGMCQALMSRLGYKGLLIEDLKFNRTFRLLGALLLTLPFAVFLESLAVIFKKGGIIRVYGRYNH